MAYAHVAHDCVVGSHCVIANNGTLAGHVTIEDRAVIGGLLLATIVTLLIVPVIYATLRRTAPRVGSELDELIA
jgi:carbonic anhydrase/acetyltransferase-like protein (isoleucine patch superfamily)